MHKHYNQFWVIGQGQGEWNYSSVAEAAAAMPENFNFVNPPVRGKPASLTMPHYCLISS